MNKTVLCYGNSNVWGYIPGSFDAKVMLGSRYGAAERWTGILASSLPADEFSVIEAGLNGRTTQYPDEVANKPYRNGLASLPMCLEMHYPLYLVIFLIGTNDLKVQYDKSVADITEGMRQLVRCVQTSNFGLHAQPPKVLLIAPQPLVREGLMMQFFDDASIEKSFALAAAYEQMAAEEKVLFLDAGKIVTSSSKDGIHLEVASHKILAEKVRERVLNL